MHMHTCVVCVCVSGLCHHLMCCRYVVCKGYIDVERNVSRYLLDINDQLNALRGTEEDVLEVRRRGGGGGSGDLHTCIQYVTIIMITFRSICIPFSSILRIIQ